MEDRVRILEERLSHQQVLLEDLDGVVRSCMQRLEIAERKIVELGGRIAEGGVEIGPADEPPPHY